jgi:hypothetical protein
VSAASVRVSAASVRVSAALSCVLLPSDGPSLAFSLGVGRRPASAQQVTKYKKKGGVMPTLNVISNDEARGWVGIEKATQARERI